MTSCIENRALEVVCDSSDVNEQTKAGIPRLPLTNATFLCSIVGQAVPLLHQTLRRHQGILTSSRVPLEEWS